MLICILFDREVGGTETDRYYNSLYNKVIEYLRNAVASFDRNLKRSKSSMFKVGSEETSTFDLVIKYAKCAEYLVGILNDDEDTIINKEFLGGIHDLLVSRCSDKRMSSHYLAQIFVSFLCDWSQPIGLTQIVEVMLKKKIIYLHFCFVPDAIDKILKLTRSCGDKEQKTVKSGKFDNSTYNCTKSGLKTNIITCLYRRYMSNDFTDELKERYRCYLEEYSL